MFITSQNGQIIEDQTEFGLCNDTMLTLQMNVAQRAGVALQYGFNTGSNTASSAAQVANTEIYSGCNGHQWEMVNQVNTTPAGLSEIHSYSIPLTSGVIGVLSDKFLNIGRTSKLQLVLQTASVLPIRRRVVVPRVPVERPYG